MKTPHALRTALLGATLGGALATTAVADLLLAPGDPIIGGQSDGTTNFTQGLAGDANNGTNNWPTAEPPAELIDGFYGGGGAKYLNFAELNTGVIVTPSAGPTVVTSMTVWTANDAVDRDPADYELYGTNAEIVDGGPGATYPLNAFTLISSGPLALPADRNTVATPLGPTPFASGFRQTVEIVNSSSYTSYMLLFPNVKNAAGANSMQVSEVAFEGNLGTGTPLEITEIDFDQVNDMLTITWRSEPGDVYGLFYSPDLIDWGADLNDSIDSEGETTSFGPFANPGSGKGFFRVQRN